MRTDGDASPSGSDAETSQEGAASEVRGRPERGGQESPPVRFLDLTGVSMTGLASDTLVDLDGYVPL